MIVKCDIRETSENGMLGNHGLVCGSGHWVGLMDKVHSQHIGVYFLRPRLVLLDLFRKKKSHMGGKTCLTTKSTEIVQHYKLAEHREAYLDTQKSFVLFFFFITTGVSTTPKPTALGNQRVGLGVY